HIWTTFRLFHSSEGLLGEVEHLEDAMIERGWEAPTRHGFGMLGYFDQAAWPAVVIDAAGFVATRDETPLRRMFVQVLELEPQTGSSRALLLACIVEMPATTDGPLKRSLRQSVITLVGSFPSERFGQDWQPRRKRLWYGGNGASDSEPTSATRPEN
ncbi:MAG: hypothetical protein AAGK78_08165, partial [Planctomycetota bacterium]